MIGPIRNSTHIQMMVKIMLSAVLMAAIVSASTVSVSLNGCLKINQASIVLPGTDSKSLSAALSSVSEQFPVTVFATDSFFQDPTLLGHLQKIRAGGLHTIGYQFSPAISTHISRMRPQQLLAHLNKAKSSFKQSLDQALMYVLVPSASPQSVVDTIVRAGLYPVVPNMSDDQLHAVTDKAQLASAPHGYVLAVNPANAVDTPDLANVFHAAGYDIAPLTHCLPVSYKDPSVLSKVAEAKPQEDDLKAGKANSTQPPAKSDVVQDGDEEEETGVSWGLVAVGAFVIGGIVLAIYFYNSQQQQ